MVRWLVFIVVVERSRVNLRHFLQNSQMARLISLNTFPSANGSLTVFEGVLPGTIERLFYIYDVGNGARAGHRHHRAWNALICVNGQCSVYVHDGDHEATYVLNKPDECLILEPRDWHRMDQFSEGAVLVVLSNEPYDKADYIYEPYPALLVTTNPT